MNEVGTSQTSQQLAVGISSSKGATDTRTNGKDLPSNASVDNQKKLEVEQEANESTQQGNQTQDVGQAVAQINDYVQSINRDLQFHVDDDLEQTVIKVVDGDSGKLIRQIPEDIFLELARTLKENGQISLLDELG